jgi:molecular chaperone DnaK
MSKLIGIDLGTSTCEAAIYQNNAVEMIANEDNDIVIPSVIGLDENNEFIFGKKAQDQLLLKPESTTMEVKRKIGSDQMIHLGNTSYSATELSAKLLGYIKDYASKALGEPVERAVITVPAYFDDIARRATLQAGEMAGLKVERIINEPTSASLAYGLDHLEEESYILIYDLGGGTFDVTLLEMFNGLLEVKASCGDAQLGGKDFDEAIMNWLCDRFYQKHNVDLKENLAAMVKLKQAAEEAKKQLSAKEEVTISIPMIASKNNLPLSLEETLTSQEFQKISYDLISRTHQPITQVLEDASLKPEDLDRILLVGGSTRMPIVYNDVAKFLQQEPDRVLDPDFSVAKGAAIMAAMIEGDISRQNSLIMTDINPFSLGTRVTTDYEDDVMDILIPRNSTLPTTKVQRYYTCYDYQTLVGVDVYQGEDKKASNNKLLGEFDLDGIPPAKAEEESIDISFTYNINGILDVKAKINSTQKEAGIQINMLDQSGQEENDEDDFDDEQFAKTFGLSLSEESEKFLETWIEMPKAKKYRAIIRRAEKAILVADQELFPDEKQITLLKETVKLLKMSIVLENELAAEIAADTLKKALSV